MRSIKDWHMEVCLDHPQYFPGAGIAHTAFDGVEVGIGDSPREALDDALDGLAMGDWDISSEFEEEIQRHLGTKICNESVCRPDLSCVRLCQDIRGSLGLSGDAPTRDGGLCYHVIVWVR